MVMAVVLIAAGLVGDFVFSLPNYNLAYRRIRADVDFALLTDLVFTIHQRTVVATLMARRGCGQLNEQSNGDQA